MRLVQTDIKLLMRLAKTDVEFIMRDVYQLKKRTDATSLSNLCITLILGLRLTLFYTSILDHAFQQSLLLGQYNDQLR